MSNRVRDRTEEVGVLMDIVGSDHYPIKIVIREGGKGNKNSSNDNGGRVQHFNWNRCSKEQRQQYEWEITEWLMSSPAPEVFQCKGK